MSATPLQAKRNVFYGAHDSYYEHPPIIIPAQPCNTHSADFSANWNPYLCHGVSAPSTRTARAFATYRSCPGAERKTSTVVPVPRATGKLHKNPPALTFSVVVSCSNDRPWL